jgi:hypothetical protein
MQKIRIIPKTTRAKNRVREHGEIMFLVREDFFRGEMAILVESLEETWQGTTPPSKWGGWFKNSEADFELI